MNPDNRKALLLAYSAGGAFALVYQIAWFHAFVNQFGASGTTFLVVVCTFIGSLGVGSYFSTDVYRAVDSRMGGHGLKNYGRTEIAVALAAISLFGLTRMDLSSVLGDFPYSLRQASGIRYFAPTISYQFLKILLAVIAVGVPCFLMGLTFPYLCSVFQEDSRFPSQLYAANTLGAALAVLTVEFVGLELLGYMGCLSLAALGNLCVGLWFLRYPRIEPATAREEQRQTGEISIYPGILSGFLCGGAQALAFILVKLTLGSSKAAFALLTFFAISGIWLASSLVHRFSPSRRFLLVAAWGALVWCVIVWYAEPAISHFCVLWGIHNFPSWSPYSVAFLTTAAAICAQMFLPYMLWSMLLPDLCNRLQARGVSLSRPYAYNTLSFLTGILLFGWILQNIHFFFAARAFGWISAVGLLLLTVSPGDRKLPLRACIASAAAVVVVLLSIPRSLEMRILGGLPDQEKVVLDYRSTAQHLFWVRQEKASGFFSLMFDRHSMSGTGSCAKVYMRAMAHYPLLTHPNPEKVLLICFGVGNTADAIRMHESVRQLDIVDLNPSVLELNHHFTRENGNVLADPRIRAIIDDGRQYLKFGATMYDFVTMEPPPPLQPGISRLYSEEFYSSIQKRLSPNGLVSQWLPENQMDQRAVDLVCSTFVRSFRHTLLFIGCRRSLILVGSNQPIDLGAILQNLSRSPGVASDLKRVGMGPDQFFEAILKTDRAMQKEWGEGQTISDGFTSLESIQVGPAQTLHPRNDFEKTKPNLMYDFSDVLGTLRQTVPQAASTVEEFYRDPYRDPVALRIIAPLYFPNSEVLIKKQQER